MKKGRNRKKAKSWSPPWNGKKNHLSWSVDLLNELEWKRFEEVVSEYYRLLGYRSEVTRMGADGGVDVILYQQGVETPAIFTHSAPLPSARTKSHLLPADHTPA